MKFTDVPLKVGSHVLHDEDTGLTVIAFVIDEEKVEPSKSGRSLILASSGYQFMSLGADPEESEYYLRGFLGRRLPADEEEDDESQSGVVHEARQVAARADLRASRTPKTKPSRYSPPHRRR